MSISTDNNANNGCFLGSFQQDTSVLGVCSRKLITIMNVVIISSLVIITQGGRAFIFKNSKDIFTLLPFET